MYRSMQKNNSRTKLNPDEFGPVNLKHDLFWGPAQGKGLFQCCVHDCKAKLPVCRIVNHCRSLHSDSFHETEAVRQLWVHRGGLDDSFSVLTVDLENCTKIFRFGNFGLIYLCFRSYKLQGDSNQGTVVKGWAQIAAPHSYAKQLRYTLRVRTHAVTFEYTDIPHTANTTSEKILDSGCCLQTVLDMDIEHVFIEFNIKTNRATQKHKHVTTITRLHSRPGKYPL